MLLQFAKLSWCNENVFHSQVLLLFANLSVVICYVVIANDVGLLLCSTRNIVLALFPVLFVSISLCGLHYGQILWNFSLRNFHFVSMEIVDRKIMSFRTNCSYFLFLLYNHNCDVRLSLFELMKSTNDHEIIQR